MDQTLQEKLGWIKIEAKHPASEQKETLINYLKLFLNKSKTS